MKITHGRLFYVSFFLLFYVSLHYKAALINTFTLRAGKMKVPEDTKSSNLTPERCGWRWFLKLADHSTTTLDREYMALQLNGVTEIVTILQFP